MMEEGATEFKYVLKTPFDYTFKGDTAKAEFITLSAPTSKTTQECSALKQAFFRAMGEREGKGGKADVDAEVDDIEGSDVLILIAMSNNVDLSDVMDNAKKLFQQPNIAMIDGETKMKTELIGRMSVDDLEDMLGEYMVNFTLASSMKRLKNKSSKESQT